ncbi:hypothetical protein VTL71DRAFT_16522 [Oculimacula yallundae]|uniref:NADPH--cytochrome P450 reductase n=1 Tax=Oculimacula yallundae TaxID=86028 RepID=A0ABR4CEP6_9HELO
MAFSDPLDFLVLCVVLFTAAYYTTNGKSGRFFKSKAAEDSKSDADDEFDDDERNIAIKVRDESADCVVFFGSQTGTAESYANKLAREAASRFNLKPILADLADFDPPHLRSLSDNVLCFFVLATFGEGDPTDNAQAWWDYIEEEGDSSSGGDATEKPLERLHYAAFGLGDKSYENYNAVIKRVDAFLVQSGGARLGPLGMGDAAQNTTEEDFLEWKEEAWAAAAQKLNLEEREQVYLPTVKVVQLPVSTMTSSKVSKGHINPAQSAVARPGPYSGTKPYLATLLESRELIKSGNRNCLHMELNFEGSPLTYTTGDHVGINPINPSVEVDRFLTVFGLLQRRNEIISISFPSTQNKVDFPPTTTIDALARYYLEICKPVSRQLTALLAQFAPNETSRQQLKKLGSDREHFHPQISANYFNLAQMCQKVSNGADWSGVPISLLIEEIGPLKPRFYSISSSSMLQKDSLSITAVVTSHEALDQSHVMKGVATNYLLALQQKHNGEPALAVPQLLDSDSDQVAGLRLPIHIRKSKFRLPKDATLPVIMVGPGTGVAPFRGFIQERLCQRRSGIKVGPLLLFFGSRRQDEDFLYAEEWKQYQEILGPEFEVITAFSREGTSKTYVQHRLLEQAEKVNSMLQQGGYFYVCGDASSMARDVNKTVVEIVSQTRKQTAEYGAKEVQKMKALGRYQEDVW